MVPKYYIFRFTLSFSLYLVVFFRSAIVFGINKIFAFVLEINGAIYSLAVCCLNFQTEVFPKVNIPKFEEFGFKVCTGGKDRLT